MPGISLDNSNTANKAVSSILSSYIFPEIPDFCTSFSKIAFGFRSLLTVSTEFKIVFDPLPEEFTEFLIVLIDLKNSSTSIVIIRVHRLLLRVPHHIHRLLLWMPSYLKLPKPSFYSNLLPYASNSLFAATSKINSFAL